METGNWVNIIKSIKTPISMLVLVTLIVGSLLHVTDDPIVQWGALILLFIIVISCLIHAIKNNALFPNEIISIWSKNDLPLDIGENEAWLGRWNCRWTFRSKDNQLKPYVDDIIEISEVDCETGEITGFGHSSYTKGARYTLKGRASNKRVAHIFYTSPTATSGLSGMVILNRPPIGDITGWWIGAGRKGGDTGGGVIMERHDNDTEFKLQNYEID